MGLRVLIIESELEGETGVRSILEKSGHEAVSVSADPAAVGCAIDESVPDAALIRGRVGRSQPVEDGVISLLVDNARCPVIVLADQHQDELLDWAVSRGAFGYLVGPLEAGGLAGAVATAVARHRDIEAVRDETWRVRSALEVRKLAERAKYILMERMSLSEADAFAHLRQKCRNQNKTMRDAAEEIIQAEREFLAASGKEPLKREMAVEETRVER